MIQDTAVAGKAAGTSINAPTTAITNNDTTPTAITLWTQKTMEEREKMSEWQTLDDDRCENIEDKTLDEGFECTVPYKIIKSLHLFFFQKVHSYPKTLKVYERFKWYCWGNLPYTEIKITK